MTSAHLSARREVRRQTRALVNRHHDVAVHLARVHASLQLKGIEPVQGALADLFGSFGETSSALKAAALQLAAPRLGSRTARLFEVWVAGPPLPRITPLATRWSLMVSPSADTPTRSRRCSPDDSRTLAAQFLVACDAQEAGAQEAFLHHCLTCQDRLAFMLARRELLKRHGSLPAEWVEVQTAFQDESSHT